MKQIQIDGISQDKVQFGTKITIESGKEKYSFFNSKKDGGETRAYSQFKQFGFGIGDVVFAEVKEEQKSFKGDEGNDIKYTQRTILYFEDPNAGGGTPAKKEVKKVAEPKGVFNAEIAFRQIEAEVSGLRKRIEKLEDPNNPFNE